MKKIKVLIAALLSVTLVAGTTVPSYAASSTVEIEVKATSAMLYESFGCKGFARFDYILNEEGLFFIEVNIVPGMSEASIMPKQAAEMGINFKDM